MKTATAPQTPRKNIGRLQILWPDRYASWIVALYGIRKTFAVLLPFTKLWPLVHNREFGQLLFSPPDRCKLEKSEAAIVEPH